MTDKDVGSREPADYPDHEQDDDVRVCPECARYECECDDDEDDDGCPKCGGDPLNNVDCICDE